MSLIGTDGLESALREILETMQRQSIEISNLRSSLSFTVTRTDLQDLERGFQSRLQALEGRLERLESETSVNLPLEVLLESNAPEGGDEGGKEAGGGGGGGGVGGGPAGGGMARIPIARYITAHHTHLRHLHRTLDLAATRGELAGVRREGEEALARALRGVEEERASKEVVGQVSQAMSALQEEVSAVQGSLATKVDRSDVSRMAAIAAELNSYATFKASASSDMRELGVRTEEHRAALDRSLESLAKLSAVVQALAGSCAGKADGRELATLSNTLERLVGEVGRRALTEDVRALSTSLSTVVGRTAGLEASAKEVSRAGMEERRALEARVGSEIAKVRGEVASAVEAGRRDVGSVREEVSARAYVTSLEATDEALAEAEARLELAHKKADVALRFIDWYADKGEAYEYNAGSLERAMNSLAVDNRSRVVDSMSDMRARVFAGDVSGALRSSLGPSQFNAAAAAASQSRGGGPLTGSTGVRLGGTM